MVEKWAHRDRKVKKRKTGMVVTNRNLKSVILPLLGKKKEKK